MCILCLPFIYSYIQDAIKSLEPFLKDILSYYEAKDHLLKSLIALTQYHLCQMRHNSCTIRVNTISDSNIEIKGINTQTLGVAVYLTVSLFNHSCYPNTLLRSVQYVIYTCIVLCVRFCGNVVSLVVCCATISNAEELTHSYGKE